MTKLERCIYCSAEFNAGVGEGDHVIPAALGEFRSDIRFRRVCAPCNHVIGRSEEQFHRCSPEAFYRRAIAAAAPRRRKRSKGYGRGARGMPPPHFTAFTGDHTQLVRPIDGELGNAHAIDQLVVQLPDGSEKHFELFPGMRPEQLKERIAQAQIGEFKKAWVHCDQANWHEFMALARNAFPNMKSEEGPNTPAGWHQVTGRAAFTLGNEYFRVIAKIAFHYYLTNGRRGLRGDEPEFAAIRDFIIHGGDPGAYFDVPGPTFALPFGELSSGRLTSPSKWCHILAAHETSREIFGYVHLFAGPGISRKPHTIRLGPIAGKIVLPLGAFAHVFEYDEKQPAFGWAGDVRQATIHRLK